jgi:hypothetical protein
VFGIRAQQRFGKFLQQVFSTANRGWSTRVGHHGADLRILLDRTPKLVGLWLGESKVHDVATADHEAQHAAVVVRLDRGPAGVPYPDDDDADAVEDAKQRRSGK